LSCSGAAGVKEFVLHLPLMSGSRALNASSIRSISGSPASAGKSTAASCAGEVGGMLARSRQAQPSGAVLRPLVTLIFGMPWTSRPKTTLSRTVGAGAGRNSGRSCPVYAGGPLAVLPAHADDVFPSISILPPVGSISRLMHRRSVDFRSGKSHQDKNFAGITSKETS